MTTEFASSRLSVHLGTKESNQVTSKTKAMYIPARSMPTDPSVTKDYDVGDKGNFISSCDSFRYLVTQIAPDLKESFDIDTRIRVAPRAFRPTKDIFL
jgi:hypothetical protein